MSAGNIGTTIASPWKSVSLGNQKTTDSNYIAVTLNYRAVVYGDTLSSLSGYWNYINATGIRLEMYASTTSSGYDISDLDTSIIFRISPNDETLDSIMNLRSYHVSNETSTTYVSQGSYEVSSDEAIASGTNKIVRLHAYKISSSGLYPTLVYLSTGLFGTNGHYYSSSKDISGLNVNGNSVTYSNCSGRVRVNVYPLSIIAGGTSYTASSAIAFDYFMPIRYAVSYSNGDSGWEVETLPSTLYGNAAEYITIAGALKTKERLFSVTSSLTVTLINGTPSKTSITLTATGGKKTTVSGWGELTPGTNWQPIIDSTLTASFVDTTTWSTNPTGKITTPTMSSADTGYSLPATTNWTLDPAATIDGTASTTTLAANTEYTFTSPASSYTLSASCTENTYTVKFHTNGGSGTDELTLSFTYTESKELTSASTLGYSRTGYSFSGWATSATGSVAYTDKQIVSGLASGSGDVVNLYAVWSAKTYYIYYSKTNSSATGSTTQTGIKYGSTGKVASNGFSLTGFTFSNWNTKSDNTGTSYNAGATYPASGTMGAANVTLYAIWSRNNYTLTLQGNGGTTSSGVTFDTLSMPYNVLTKVKDNPFSKTGYTFYNFNSQSDGSGTPYTYYTIGAADATLYAYWVENKYNIVFNSNGATSGSMSSIDNVKYTTAVTLTKNSYSRTGYKFIGWNTSSTATTAEYSDEASVSKLSATDGATVTLYAIWEALSFTVTLDKNGGSGGTDSITATYGSAMPSITKPTLLGNKFLGYYTSGNIQYIKADGTSAKNSDFTAATTLYAHWQRQYTVNVYNKSTSTWAPIQEIKVANSSTTGGYDTYTYENVYVYNGSTWVQCTPKED